MGANFGRSSSLKPEYPGPSQQPNSHLTVDSLPFDVLAYVFKFLPNDDLLRVSLVNSVLYSTVRRVIRYPSPRVIVIPHLECNDKRIGLAVYNSKQYLGTFTIMPSGKIIERDAKVLGPEIGSNFESSLHKFFEWIKTRMEFLNKRSLERSKNPPGIPTMRLAPKFLNFLNASQEEIIVKSLVETECSIGYLTVEFDANNNSAMNFARRLVEKKLVRIVQFEKPISHDEMVWFGQNCSLCIAHCADHQTVPNCIRRLKELKRSDQKLKEKPFSIRCQLNSWIHRDNDISSALSQADAPCFKVTLTEGEDRLAPWTSRQQYANITAI